VQIQRGAGFVNSDNLLSFACQASAVVDIGHIAAVKVQA